VREAIYTALEEDIEREFKTKELIDATENHIEGNDLKRSSLTTYVHEIIEDLKLEEKITKIGYGKYLVSPDYSLDKMTKELISKSQQLKPPDSMQN